MENLTTIWESFELPSGGVIYTPNVNPHIRLRSMTTAEELKRLSPSDTPFKVLCDIIEDCMEEKPAIHVSDFCLGDYEYLLYKLRTVTYGNDYRMSVKCPECGEITESVANLDSMEILSWKDSYNEDRIITLPVSNDEIELAFKTPHAMDLISYRNRERKKQTKSGYDYSIIYKVLYAIEKVNGMVLTDSELVKYVENLPARDSNFILFKSEQFNSKVGVDNMVETKCASCGKVIEAPFLVSNEFFRPSYN